ncbi:methyltransferase type 11 [Caulobacter sp. 17J80-11]|uniref:methyltransferase type 11 n=1 Tax=Caulobacter sp. 17J80-11 TaxID=2763502 RepID=UPI0016536EF3|nr:methyltransferase type 11 [Caulobacter sp. 17J80-11]MBC6980590.1 methyltransferase type 11 [Caulobacter sp. 17J80-11]
MRKSMLVAAASLAAMFLSACGDEPSIRIRKTVDTDEHGPLRVVNQLECPEQQGPLTRTRTSADGLSCVYSGPRGAEVTLRLVRVAAGSDAEAALQPIEKELQALMPQTVAKAAKAEAEAQARAEADGRAADVAEAEALRAEKAAIAAERQAHADERAAMAAAARAEADARRAEVREARVSGSSRDNVDVRLPGLTVRSEGEKTVVRLPGLKVDADDAGAKVRIGGVRINADDASGKVSIDDGDEQVDIRAHDESAEIRSRSTSSGLRATYILVDEVASAQGWKLVGYEARGPEGGPIVVAVVKSKDRKEDAVFDAAKALVKRNVGGGD